MGFITSAIAIGTALGVGGAGLAAGLTGAAVIGAAGYGASKLISGGGEKGGSSGGSSTAPAALPPPPSVGTAAVEAQEAINVKRRAVARNRTNYTSPIGLNDSAKSDLALKTLTGQ